MAKQGLQSVPSKEKGCFVPLTCAKGSNLFDLRQLMLFLVSREQPEYALLAWRASSKGHNGEPKGSARFAPVPSAQFSF